MMIKKYATWNIDENLRATQEWCGKTVEVQLNEAENHVEYEGWFPKRPTSTPEAAITGVCLFDCRWAVEFKPKQKKAPGAKRTLALPHRREDALRRLANGEQAERIHIPMTMTAYHKKYIAWIAEKASQLTLKTVYFHLPVDEYHYSIAELETVMGRKCETMHAMLDTFAQSVKDFVKQTITSCEVVFVSPMQHGASTPQASYLLPYIDPARVGMPTQGVIGLEDLVETKILLHAQNLGKAKIHSVLGSVISVPHPYLEGQGPVEIISPNGDHGL